MEILPQKNTLQSLASDVNHPIYHELTAQDLLLRLGGLNEQFHLDAKQMFALWTKLIVIDKVSDSAIAALQEVQLLNLEVKTSLGTHEDIIYPHEGIYTLKNIQFLCLRGFHLNVGSITNLAHLPKMTKLDLKDSYITKGCLDVLEIIKRPDLKIVEQHIPAKSQIREIGSPMWIDLALLLLGTIGGSSQSFVTRPPTFQMTTLCCSPDSKSANSKSETPPKSATENISTMTTKPKMSPLINSSASFSWRRLAENCIQTYSIFSLMHLWKSLPLSDERIEQPPKK